MRKLLAALLFILSAQNAWAVVTYQWQMTSSSDPTAWLSGEIVFHDNSWAAGGLDYRHPFDWARCPPECDKTDPDSPIERVLMTLHYPASSYGGLSETIDMYPVTGEGFRYPVTWVDVSLQFSPDGSLSGRIAAQDGFAGVRLSSEDGIWTMLRWGSDPYGTFCAYSACGTGQLLLTGVFARVPEPATWLLLGIGLLAWAWLRRGHYIAATVKQSIT